MRTMTSAICMSLFMFNNAFAAPPEPKPLPVGSPMYYSSGNDVAWQSVVPPEVKALSHEEASAAISNRARIAHREGITALEAYAKWWLCEPEPGKWDFSYYDLFDQAVKDVGMRWLPLIIAGPAYGTPPWFKASKESVSSRCLEHGIDTATQSIWNPNMRPRVSEYLRRFSAHFDAERIESIQTGISGDFGEALYTAGGNIWTYLHAPYHVHMGYWCGDPYARDDFRRAMTAQYKTVERLNTAWGTSFKEFKEIEPFLPEKAPNWRARLDLQRWYCAAMTGYVDFWVRESRRFFPKSRIQVAAGGDGRSICGGDFSAQAEIASRYHAGMRITNEASDYATNFMWTRQVTSACRFYKTYCGIEPAGGVTTEAIPSRVYNATASGADELFTYDPEPEGARARQYSKVRRFLVKREPLVDVGYFLNRTSWDLDRLNRYWQIGIDLRAVTDFDIIDERLMAAGALKDKRVFIWLDGPIVEQSTANVLEKWVRKGGLLMIQGREQIETVEGSPLAWLSGIAVDGGRQTPDRYMIDVGNAAYETNLLGNWHGIETDNGFLPPDSTFRWSTDGSQVDLPVPGDKGITIVVRIVANGPRVKDQHLIVDGKVVAHPDEIGVQTLSFRLTPAQIAGRSSIRLTFGGTTWQGSESDTRQLGVAVASVAVGAGQIDPAELTAPPTLGLVTGLNMERLAQPPFTTRLGRGAVVSLPMGDLKMEDLAREAVYHTERFLPNRKAPYPIIESDRTVYVTRFRDSSALVLNGGDTKAHIKYDGRSKVVAPHSIESILPGMLKINSRDLIWR
ncbi:MAG: beta-galactosidase [Armatimonadota bacterium]